MNVSMNDSGTLCPSTIAKQLVTLAGLKNGELLVAAEMAKFEVFLTVDQGIEYQQNLTGRNIGIIIFRTKSNRLTDLLPHVRACLAYIESIQPGQIVRIESS
jgi:hypothetical protein